MEDQKNIYDYAIVGAGAAGLHLALAMIDDNYFATKKILIVEKESKNINDRTWCFWENENGLWDKIITKSWSTGFFITKEKSIKLDMKNYHYKMLRGIDFYNHAKSKISSTENISWINDDVKSVQEESGNVSINCSDKKYFALHVFDSRVPQDYFAPDNPYIIIQQHFKGWVIETESDFFNDIEFVMMDYRTQWKDNACFTYVLPISPCKALVEFTFFTPHLVDDSVYDQMLNQYIDAILKPGKYKITEIEKGVIPMSNFPFHKYHTPHITKVGTGGGWVKPSSGYSFKNAERFAQKIISNIKAKRIPSHGIAKSRFRKYDTLFLDILKTQNYLGEKLFTEMYSNCPAHLIFKFLDEQTTLTEDLKVVSAFAPLPFLKSLSRNIL